MIPGFSGEMIFLFFLALILFGPKKLPEIGRQIGRIMNEFRRASNEFRSQIESEINALEVQKPQILPPGRDPLGSLASRILNPPPPEQIRAVDDREAVARSAETKAAEPNSASAGENAGATKTPVAASSSPTIPSKVAPDA